MGYIYIYIYISVLVSSVVRSLAAGAKGPGLNSPVHPALSEIYFSSIFLFTFNAVGSFFYNELGLCPSLWVHFLLVYLDSIV